MRSPGPLLLGAIVTMACAAQQVPPTRARASHRYVLVSGGTTLRSRADDGAAGVALSTPYTFRHVRDRGDWVEVETVTDNARQCMPGLSPPEGMRLRFFVRAASLAQVLARPLAITGPEGSLAVQPGVQVVEGSRRTAPAEIVHAGLRLTLVLTPAVGREHTAPRAERTITRAERLAPGTRATLPDGIVMEVERDANVYVVSRRSVSDGARVVVATPCVRFEAVVPERAVLPVMELDVDERETPTTTRWTLRQGARLRWPSGGIAGRANAAVRIADEGNEANGTRCFHIPLRVVGGAPNAQPLETDVCARVADLQREGAP